MELKKTLGLDISIFNYKCMIYKFETWMNSDVDHHVISFKDKESLDRFVRDFITEHTRWGKWIDVVDNSSIKLKKTLGDETGKYYNLKITWKE